MRNFFSNCFRFLLVGISLLIIFLSGYLAYDPFKVLYPYHDYSYPYVIPNRDYISTVMFVKNYKKYNYNSFVFGSSRTLAFRPDSWLKYLSANDVPFMFDASSESIYGIYTKIKYLDSMHVKMDNVLIILCRDASFVYSVNHKGHLFIKHPLTSKESSLNFQLNFFKAYLDPKFMFSFYDYTFTKKFKSYMTGFIETRKITYDTITNKIDIIDQENEIVQHPEQYYFKRRELFYVRKEERIDSIERINSKQLAMLNDLEQILEKNNTKYKVVLSPLYEQIKLNPVDLSKLKNIFGNNLYDFSGKNSFSDSISNYYEPMHFRPKVGDSILSRIYK